GVSFPGNGIVVPASPLQGFLRRAFNPNMLYESLGKKDDAYSEPTKFPNVTNSASVGSGSESRGPVIPQRSFWIRPDRSGGDVVVLRHRDGNPDNQRDQVDLYDSSIMVKIVDLDHF